MEWGILISLLALVLSTINAYRNSHRDNKKDTEEMDARFEGLKERLIKVDTKLDQVGRDTAETRADIKSLSKDIANMDRRVSLLERELQTAFIQIDELKEAIKK